MSAAPDSSRWAAVAAIAVLAVGLYLGFRRIDEWAEHAFAQARLASMLVAVIDAALFGVALCLAPVLSRWIARAGGRSV